MPAPHRFPPTRGRAAVALALLALIGPAGATAAVHAAWQRTPAVALAPGTCHELQVARRGSGFLELRLGTTGLPAVGVDLRITGMSAFVSAEGERVSVGLLHGSGPYVRHLHADGPLRWRVDGRTVCLAAGPRPLACGVSTGEPTSMQVVPFGSGWATAFVACPPGAAPPRAVAAPAARVLGAAVVFALGFVAYLRGSRWREWPVAALPLATVTWAILVRDDPGRVSPLLPTVALALGSGAVGYRLLRLRPRRALALAALVAGAGAAAMLVPHPVASADDVATAPAAAPPLAVDPAYWHFLAPHQRLGFVQHSLAEVAGPADETWLVVGGSVTAGTEVDPAETYTAVAERTLRATGQRVRLVNAAVSGWHIGQIDQLLRDLGDRLPARGVVVASVLKNAAFRIVGRPDPPTTDSLLWTYWYGLGRNHLLLPGVSFFMPKPDNGDRLQRTLDRLIVREQGLGRTIVLLDETHEAQLGPTWYNAWLGRPQEAQRQVIRDVAAQHDLRLHRVDDVVAALPPAERFLDGMHLTRAGHAAVGARLAAILTREREAPRP